MGGDCIGSDLVYLSTGYDFVKMVIQTATGQPVEWEKQEHAAAAAVRAGRLECPEMPWRETVAIARIMEDLRRGWGCALSPQ